MALLWGVLICFRLLSQCLPLPVKPASSQVSSEKVVVLADLLTPLLQERDGAMGPLEMINPVDLLYGSNEKRKKRRTSYEGYKKHIVEIAPLRQKKNKDGKTPLAIILTASDLMDKNDKRTKNKNLLKKQRVKGIAGEKKTLGKGKKYLKSNPGKVNKLKFSLDIEPVGDKENKVKESVSESEDISDEDVSVANLNSETEEIDWNKELVRSKKVKHKSSESKGSESKEKFIKGIKSWIDENSQSVNKQTISKEIRETKEADEIKESRESEESTSKETETENSEVPIGRNIQESERKDSLESKEVNDESKESKSMESRNKESRENINSKNKDIIETIKSNKNEKRLSKVNNDTKESKENDKDIVHRGVKNSGEHKNMKRRHSHEEIYSKESKNSKKKTNLSKSESSQQFTKEISNGSQNKMNSKESNSKENVQVSFIDSHHNDLSIAEEKEGSNAEEKVWLAQEDSVILSANNYNKETVEFVSVEKHKTDENNDDEMLSNESKPDKHSNYVRDNILIVTPKSNENNENYYKNIKFLYANAEDNMHIMNEDKSGEIHFRTSKISKNSDKPYTVAENVFSSSELKKKLENLLHSKENSKESVEVKIIDFHTKDKDHSLKSSSHSSEDLNELLDKDNVIILSNLNDNVKLQPKSKSIETDDIISGYISGNNLKTKDSNEIQIIALDQLENSNIASPQETIGVIDPLHDELDIHKLTKKDSVEKGKINSEKGDRAQKFKTYNLSFLFTK